MNLVPNIRMWRQLTLLRQFLLGGAIVMLCAMIAVGSWVAQRIEASVVQNSTAAAASLVESVISPLSQELSQTARLSAPARQALREIFEGTAIGNRVVSYKIWRVDGTIVDASNLNLLGQKFEPSRELLDAASGKIDASFKNLNSLEDEAEAALGFPLLEVYSPIREAWTGKIIGVAEFYERADVLEQDMPAHGAPAGSSLEAPLLVVAFCYSALFRLAVTLFYASRKNSVVNSKRPKSYRSKTWNCANVPCKHQHDPRHKPSALCVMLDLNSTMVQPNI